MNDAKATFHDPPVPKHVHAPTRSVNGVMKLVMLAAGAVAVGLGSSYITVLTATPNRGEVREMIGTAIGAAPNRGEVREMIGTAIGAAPNRGEVREMIGTAINAVKETRGLDRESLLEWKADQKAAMEGLRADVQSLRDQQNKTNGLLERLLLKGEKP